MRRFFVEEMSDVGTRAALDAEGQQHAAVLRLSDGDAVTLFDGNGHEAHGVLRGTLHAFSCEVLERVDALAERPHVSLIQCMPKGDKLDSIVRMTTEIGVREIHLATSERAISRPSDAKVDARVERLLRVAREAARQSEQPFVPVIVAPRDLLATAKTVANDALRLVLVPYATQSLDASIASWNGTLDAVLVVGPEGGLSDAEIQSLSGEGFLPVSIGTHVLRVETAAPIGVALASAALSRSQAKSQR